MPDGRPPVGGCHRRRVARSALFPISALPRVMDWWTRVLPLAHALALMRYGLLGDPAGLHAIWHMSNATASALSLAFVAALAALLTAAAIRVFTRSAVR